MTIEMKIQRARTVFHRHGDHLRGDPRIERLMLEIESHWKSSWHVMEETGVVDSCRHCEEEEGGSCCGRGIENNYSETLLILNLLWRCDLPDARRHPDACHFLGDSGCTLKIRDVLCVNYLCLAVQKRLSQAELRLVQETVGRELDAVFHLQETVKRILKTLPGGKPRNGQPASGDQKAAPSAIE